MTTEAIKWEYGFSYQVGLFFFQNCRIIRWTGIVVQRDQYFLQGIIFLKMQTKSLASMIIKKVIWVFWDLSKSNYKKNFENINERGCICLQLIYKPITAKIMKFYE